MLPRRNRFLLLATTFLVSLGIALDPGSGDLRPPVPPAEGATRDTARAYPFYRRGLALYAEGRTIDALRQFQNATFFDPDGSELRFAQGLCLLKLDEPGQAKVQFERALAKAPNHARAHYNLGLALTALGDTAAARQHLMRASAIEPRLPGVSRARARLAEKTGDMAGVLAALREERANTPDSVTTRLALGQAFAKAAQPESSLVEYEAAIGIAPRAVDAWVGKAGVLDGMARPAEAAGAWASAAALDTARADLRAAEGVSWFQAGQPETALVAFGRAVALDPRDAKSAFNQGVAFEALGRLDAALAAYREAARRDTSYADPWLNTGSLLAKQGRSGEAIAALDRYLELAPDSPRAEEIRKAKAALGRRSARRS